MMKFAVNHPWKFEDYKIAYAVGFMQMSMVVIVEFVNFVALITNNAVLDVVMNFLALVVIAEFDDYFYESSDFPELQDVITDPKCEEFLIWQTTTSYDAIHMIPENRLKKQPAEEGKVFTQKEADLIEAKAKEKQEEQDKEYARQLKILQLGKDVDDDKESKISQPRTPGLKDPMSPVLIDA